MDFFQILVLAVVQGVTEFLPISSDGHLLVANALMEAAGWPPLPDVLEVSIVLHLGTLLSVIVFFWHRLWRLLGADRRVIWLLVVATLPAVLFGLPLKKLAPEVLESTLLAGLMFPVNAVVLLISSRWSKGTTNYTELTAKQALLIGTCQAVAILPGVSRSGMTISSGLLTGLRRDSAVAFAFLMAVPAIAGAGVLEGLDWLESSQSSAPWEILVGGAAVSFIVGLAALWTLVRLVERGRLHLLAYYLFPLGIAVTWWQLAK